MSARGGRIRQQDLWEWAGLVKISGGVSRIGHETLQECTGLARCSVKISGIGTFFRNARDWPNVLQELSIASAKTDKRSAGADMYGQSFCRNGQNEQIFQSEAFERSWRNRSRVWIGVGWGSVFLRVRTRLVKLPAGEN